MLNYNLMTPWAQKLNENNPLPEYPRPYLVRDSYINLNGIWDYEITTVNEIPKTFSGKIVVPFPLESNLSGVRRDLKKNEFLCYNRKFELTSEFIKDVVMINFGAVNQICDIYINGNYVMHHIGGYLPFSLNATQFIHEGENDIVVIVENDPNLNYGVGKAGKSRGGMWYTKTSGIWQTVWVESYSITSIKNVIFYPHNDGLLKGKIRSKGTSFNIEISFNNKLLYKGNVGREFEVKLEEIHLWDLENPNLYDVVIYNDSDSVKTYFAFREFKINNGKFELNGNPIFLNGLLDQGYFSDGIYTPASYEAFEFDILKCKELGFNTLRKHIKVELPYFYYLCDKYGMLVFQDFVNNGKYSFFIDTALPTIGLQKKNDKIIHTNKLERKNFITGGELLIKYLSNHPSIIAYTIFNEGWGQFDSNNVYHHFKALYPNILFDSTSGWYRVADTDMDSYHWYFKNLDKLQKVDHPIFLSEFGALCYKVKDHAYGSDEVFGYTYFPTIPDTEQAFVDLYEQKIIPYKDKLIGTIYTQLSDVEEEDNGLLTYDRKVLKFNKETIQRVLKKLNN